MRSAKHQQALEALASVTDSRAAGPAGQSDLPVLPALTTLLPGLRRGQVVGVDGPGLLPLALLAGASQDGSWCGIVGWPECGLVSAADVGCEPSRLLLVDEPGERWADVTATLLEAVDVVLLHPPRRTPVNLIRRLVALARTAGSALIVTDTWEGASTRLYVESSLWVGVEQGHGHLQGRRVKVSASGRATGARPRSAWLWMPGADGSVSSAELAAVPAPSPSHDHEDLSPHIAS